jgi:hypothetical protein
MAKLFRGSMVQTIFLVILLVLLASGVGGSVTLLSTENLGYSSGFQGPKAKFSGIRYDSKPYTMSVAMPPDGGTTGGETGNTGTHGASMATFDTTLKFDSDGWDTGKPNIIGEMSSVFVPSSSLNNIVWWSGAKAIPQDWLRGLQYIQNPQQTYSWNVSSKTYKMEQWLMRFYLSFSGEWDGRVEGSPGLYSGFENPLQYGQVVRNYYANLEVWLEFDLKPTWYIEGQGTAYFAIGKIQVAEFKHTAHDISGNEVSLDTQMSVVPESPSSMLYIYYGLFGTSSPAEKEASSFQGRVLNPDLFTDRVFAHVDFGNFGVTAWNEFGTVKTKGDVATIGFDVTIFVIGEWDVKDIQNIPSDYGRWAQVYTPASLLDYLNDPRLQALLSMLFVVGIFIVLLIFFPSALASLLAIVGLKGRRRK